MKTLDDCLAGAGFILGREAAFLRGEHKRGVDSWDSSTDHYDLWIHPFPISMLPKTPETSFLTENVMISFKKCKQMNVVRANHLSVRQCLHLFRPIKNRVLAEIFILRLLSHKKSRDISYFAER